MPNEVGCQFWQLIVFTLPPTVFDLNALVLYVAPFGKTSRNAVTRYANSVGEAGLRNPITGAAGCCALTESGKVANVPPSPAMNSRRLIINIGTSRFPTWALYR